MKPVLLLAIALGGGVPKDDATKKELDKLQGEWIVVSAEQGGKKLSADDRKKDSEWVLKKVVFKESNVYFWISHKEMEPEEGKPVAFTLDVTKKPKQMTMNIVENTPAGIIYTLEGDTLRVCLPDNHRGDAPASFDTSKETSAYLFEFKRAKK